MNKKMLTKNRLLIALIVCCLMSALAFSTSIFTRKTSAAGSIEIWDGSIATAFSGGNGEESTPFLIANGKELALLSQLVNYDSMTLTVDGNTISNADLRKAHYKLTADIKLNDTTDWQSWTISNQPAQSFTAIGYLQTTPTTKYNYFKGVFDGDNHTIAGLFNVGADTNAPVGLFGLIYGAEIKNVGIIESSIFGQNIVGAIASYIYLNDSVPDADRISSSITNCYNTGNVTGTSVQVGGIAGIALLVTIKDCYNTGTITSTGTAGGIAATSSRKTKIINCYNEGEVIANGAIAGGITGTGDDNFVMDGCYNEGKITAKGNVGGLFGTYGNNSTPTATVIKNSYNAGEVVSSKMGESGATINSAGGIIGSITGNLTIDACYNTGKVTNLDGNYTSGIIGNNEVKAGAVANTVINCYNTGSIQSNQLILSGIAGNNMSGSLIANCYNTGEVIGKNNMTGGIVGTNITGGKIENCYSSGSVRVLASGMAKVGAVAGEARDGLSNIKNNYYLIDSTVLNGVVQNKGVGENNDAAGAVTVFHPSNDGSNGGEDGDGTFNPAITAEGTSGVTSLLSALNLYVEANNAVTADLYHTWYQGKFLSSYPDFLAAQIFTMTFDANGGSGTMASQNFTDGIAQAINANTFTRTGYKFSGWNTAANGSGTGYTAGQSATLTGNATLYAQWTALAQYTVTFDANGGTGTMASQTFYEDTAQSITVNTLTRTGYKFSGWNTSANGSGTAYTAGQSVTLTGNTTLYAQWTALAQYTVTFDANGGTGTMASQTFYAETAQGITDNTFTRTGYKFSGWNTAANGSGTGYTAGQSVTLTGNATLYAQWTALAQYTVTFDANTGTGTMPNQTFYAETAQTIQANTFTKALYKFSGWNTSANGSGTGYAVGQSVTLTGNITLYAQWTALAQYTVTFDANGGTGTMASQTFYEDTAQSIQANTFTKALHKFSGWNTSANGSGTAYTAGQSVTLTGNTTLYAQWTALAQYTVTFDANGGTGTMASQTFYAETAQSITVNTLTRTGYRFSGWNTSANGSGTAYTAGQSVTLTGNTTLYAQWTALAQYTVTFDANGGTGTMAGQTFYEDTAQSITDNTFTRTGYKFSGWNTSANGSGTAYTAGQSVTLAGNTTLYAQWTALARYTVTFDANGGTGTMASQTFYAETAQNIAANVFKKTWYRFTGWNTSANGSGTGYTAEQSVTLTGNMTLYAQWELLQQYSITYNANGGSGSMDLQIFIEGSAQPILANGFTKEGYGFVGWNTAADGSGTAYTAGQSATMTADVTLYAQWKIAFVVSFDSNNGTGSMDSQTFLDAIEQAIAGNGFTREGYIFKGWNTAADGSGQAYSNEEVLLLGASTTLYAQWQKVAVVTQKTCNSHWFVFAWIALYMVISLLFYVFFKNVKLFQVIPWGAYVLGLMISVFFLRCSQCWTLWIIGMIFALIALLLYLFNKKNKDKDPVQDAPLPISGAEEKTEKAEAEVMEQSNGQTEEQQAVKTLEEYLAEERENTENAEDALEYLTEEKTKEQKLLAKGEGEELRLQALEILFRDLEEEERKERERLNRLKQERINAETAAEAQNITPLAIVENELKNETDAERKNTLTTLREELIQEEADSKIAGTDSAAEDLPSEKELVQVHAQREQARLNYIQAKRSGAAAVAPIAFRLSREDVLDYMAKCKQKFSCGQKEFAVFEKDFDESEQLFPVETNMKGRISPKTVDSLRCGDWCFSMMYERKDVIKFIMRMDDAYAEKLKTEHSGIKRSLFPNGENWYDVIIDGSYGSKKEVFAILYHCYVFVLNHYYELKNSICTTDTEAAVQDDKAVAKQVKENENTVDPELEAAIAEKREAENLHFKMKMPIEMSRRRLLNYVQNTQPKTAEIVERERLSSPASLKVNKKTYAMVYQTKTMVRMIVKLEDDYAQMLSFIHPLIRRAKFPRGANWYIVEIDSSYTSTRQVYAMLTKARNFVADANKKAK